MLTSARAVQAPGSFGLGDESPAALAVIDVETTGLDPSTSRVVECAILTCSAPGDVLEEWSSLIAIPGIEAIGASWLHGITRTTLHSAPPFAEVAGEIVRRLQGRILVGHVVAFDVAHLRAEFSRIGACLPEILDATICTRDLARAELPTGSHSLAALCNRLGIRRTGSHTALGDARATASVLTAMIERGVDLDWSERLARARGVAWPNTCSDPNHAPRRSSTRPMLTGDC